MTNILIEVFRFPIDRRLPAIDYYILLETRQRSASTNTVTDPTIAPASHRTLSSMDNRTVVPQPTPAAAIEDAKRRLQASVLPQDVIEFNGVHYASVSDVIIAIAQAESQWR